MGRSLLIVMLVAASMVSGIAVASPADRVRVPVTPTQSHSESATVVVEKGDHLWKISERHLHEHAPENEVAPYWVDVIAVNTPKLRSGDPDLIYPGEVISLPEISERP